MVTKDVSEKQSSIQESTPMNAAEAILAAMRGKATSITENADAVNERGFTRVFDKAALIGKPFTIIDWDLEPGEYGMVAVVNIVIGTRKALFFKDGSTGVMQQLMELRDKKNLREMILCPRGLRVSDYDNPHGEGRSRTYYIDDNTAV